MISKSVLLFKWCIASFGTLLESRTSQDMSVASTFGPDEETWTPKIRTGDRKRLTRIGYWELSSRVLRRSMVESRLDRRLRGSITISSRTDYVWSVRNSESMVGEGSTERVLRGIESTMGRMSR